jgi:hypothetical protein
MGRWAERAAELGSIPHDKTDKTDKTQSEVVQIPDYTTPAWVLSVKSVLSEPPRPVSARSGLPAHPDTCVFCGSTDWLVSMTDVQVGTMHASCWKADLSQTHANPSKPAQN